MIIIVSSPDRAQQRFVEQNMIFNVSSQDRAQQCFVELVVRRISTPESSYGGTPCATAAASVAAELPNDFFFAHFPYVKKVRSRGGAVALAAVLKGRR